MKRTTPPIIKIYEALGSIADGRVEMIEKDQGMFSGNHVMEAKVYSSSRNKFYTVTYNQSTGEIMGNDNGSYRKGYLGYPMICVLMLVGDISFNEVYANALVGIMRKELNQKHKNDFAKTIEEVDVLMKEKGIDMKEWSEYVQSVIEEIEKLELRYLGKKVFPPKGY